MNSLRRVIGRVDAKIRHLRKQYLPNAFERAKKRWDADKGDATLRIDYPLDANSVVFDVGGYKGDWADAIYRRYGCSIHVFEPIPGYAQQIRGRFDGVKKIHVHSFGLSGATKKEKIFIQADGTSMFKRSGEELEVSLADVAGFVKEHGVTRIDLMKINIEGGEYDLLQSLFKADLIKDIGNLQIQFHDFVPGATKKRDAVRQRLLRTHHVTYDYPFIWENWERNTERRVD